MGPEHEPAHNMYVMELVAVMLYDLMVLSVTSKAIGDILTT